MKVKKDLNNVLRKVKELFSDETSGHDISHLKRVYKNAMKIQIKEGGDVYIIGVSALVHDVHRLMSNECGHFVTPEESLPEVNKILKECNCDKSKIGHIIKVVKNHEDKQNKNVSMETLIIQDADALDAIGRIGLRRTTLYCKKHGIPTVNKNYPLDTKEYIPDVNPLSTCHYIARTMIPNGENLYTNTARKMAKNKIKVLKRFVEKNLK